MRIFPLAAVAAISLGVALAATASAQTGLSHHNKKTPGYMDENGVFHTFAHPDPDAAAANATHSGKFVVNFSVKIETPLPAGSTIYCSADIGVDSVQAYIPPSGPASYTDIHYDETGNGSVAAGATGSTVTCPVVIYYSWSFPNSSTSTSDMVTNSVSGEYSVAAVKVPTGSSTVVALDATRESDSDLPVSPTVPTNGAATTLSVHVSL